MTKKNLNTSFLDKDGEYYKLRFVSSTLYAGLGLVTFTFYAVLNYRLGDYWAFSVETVLAILVLISLWITLKKKASLDTGASIGVLSGILILWQNFYSGGFYGTGLYWLFIWPIFVYILIGSNKARIANVIFFLGLFVLYALTKVGILPVNFPDFTLLMALISLSVNTLLFRFIHRRYEEYVYDQIMNRQRIKELNSVRDKFVDVVSLQLNSPLNAVKWNTELLIEDVKSHSLKSRLQDVYASVNTVIDRISDMLIAIDIKKDDVKISFDMFSPLSLVDDIVGRLKTAFPTHKVYIDKKGLKSSKKVLLDKNKVMAIYNAIIDNAFRYTQEKGQIDIKLSLSGKDLVLNVVDTGIGIS